ncbi:MAG: hypothetical protein R2783_05410 [Gelidibacter sp.]
MKKVILIFAMLLNSSIFSQVVPTNVANPIQSISMAYGANRPITWFTSNSGGGFGHRIINFDPGVSPLLRFQSRHSTATWSTSMVINSHGAIGIGTETPVSLLTVKQSSNNSAGGLTISDVGGNRQISIYGEGDSGRQVIATNTNNPLVFEVMGNELMRISPNGNVGIGTKDSSNKLTVNGTIHCKEVLVDLNIVPDYVFQKYYNGISGLKPEYLMPTLEEVEAFTKQNNHLPNVPSAKEIQDNGLQLKEMTAILLQKIEELTLYTIEQEKRINALERALDKKQ